MALKLFLSVGILCAIANVSSSATSKVKNDTLKVTGFDFRNTKLTQVCLLARMRYNVTIRKSSQVYSKILTQVVDSHRGSHCDQNYISLLKLHYGNATVTMNFTKQKDKSSYSPTQGEKYCINCNIGIWRLVSIKMVIANLTKFTDGQLSHPYHMILEADANGLKESMGDMTKFGIDIDRAFKCDKIDQLRIIPMKIIRVNNISSTSTSFQSSEWKVDMQFSSIQVQPFLVNTKGFADPYLCGDLTLPHALVITLPILYFIILLLIYKMRKTHGCPTTRKISDPKTEVFVAEKVPLEPTESQLLTVNYHPVTSTEDGSASTKQTSASAV